MKRAALCAIHQLEPWKFVYSIRLSMNTAVLNLFPVLWHSDVDLFVLALLVNEFLNDQKNQSVYMYFASVQLWLKIGPSCSKAE